MVALLKLLLSGVTAENGVAVLVDAVAEVLTGHANTGSFPALKLAFVDEIPLLHNPIQAIRMYCYGQCVKGKKRMVKPWLSVSLHVGHGAAAKASGASKTP